MNSVIEKARGIIAAGQWPADNGFDRYLPIFAGMFLMLGSLLLLADGLQTGFHTLQWLSLMLPALIWEHLTFMGDTLVVFTLTLLFAVRYPKLLFALLITALIGTLITHGIKPWLATPRPPAVLEPGSFQLIGSAINKKSMPSGHTLTAFAAAGLMTRLASHHAIKLLILIVAVFIGWSRVAVGVHWPADVAMGAAGGLVSAWAGLALADRWQDRFGPTLFLVLLSLHVISAALLLGYDGGLPHTYLFSIVAALSSLGFLAYQWQQHPASARKEEKR